MGEGYQPTGSWGVPYWETTDKLVDRLIQERDEALARAERYKEQLMAHICLHNNVLIDKPCIDSCSLAEGEWCDDVVKAAEEAGNG